MRHSCASLGWETVMEGRGKAERGDEECEAWSLSTVTTRETRRVVDACLSNSRHFQPVAPIAAKFSHQSLSFVNQPRDFNIFNVNHFIRRLPPYKFSGRVVQDNYSGAKVNFSRKTYLVRDTIVLLTHTFL